MTEKYCLLLGVSKNRFRSIVAAARVTNMKIAIMESDSFINANRYADIVINGPEDNPNNALNAIKLFEKQTGGIPGAVIPLTEMTLLSGKAISDHYQLAYLSDFTLSLSRDKYKMRTETSKSGFLTPKFNNFSTFNELLAYSHQMKYPLILKPINAGGSEGVSFISDPDKLEEGYQHLQKSTSHFKEKYCLPNSNYLVEEFVLPKIEISVEVLCTKKTKTVLAVTDKELTDLPYFVEIGHSLPSKESQNQQLKDLAIKICEFMKIDHGIAHTEFIIDESDNIYLLEVNTRTPGGGIPEIFEKITGVNMFELHCSSYINEETGIPKYDMKGFVAIGFMKAKEGLVKLINTTNELPSSVFGIQLWTKVGKYINKCSNNGELAGFIEYYWPDGSIETHMPEYLNLTKKLAAEMIVVE